MTDRQPTRFKKILILLELAPLFIFLWIIAFLHDPRGTIEKTRELARGEYA